MVNRGHDDLRMYSSERGERKGQTMNKYTAESLAASAGLDDRRILVITENASEAQHAIGFFTEEDPYVERIVRTNGMERVNFKRGGFIEFRSLGSHGHRGVSVDTVFLDAGVDPLLSMDDRASLAACTMCSADGELVRA